MAFHKAAGWSRDRLLHAERVRHRAAHGFSLPLLTVAGALFLTLCALLFDPPDALAALSRIGRTLEALLRLIVSVEAPF
jgi:hypothetical protein